MTGYRFFGCILTIALYLKLSESKSIAILGEPDGVDCSDIWNKNSSAGSGVYVIQPDAAADAFQVFCEMTVSGGWTIMQLRNGVEGVLFNKTWYEYEDGFGSITGEHWLGLIKMSAITRQNNRHCKLRISLEDFSSPTRTAYAEYGTFTIGSSSELYKLSVQNYSGTAGDAFKGNRLAGTNQNGSNFSTEDGVHDNCSPVCALGDILYKSCSAMVSSGWWFNACGNANLNGCYLTPPNHKFQLCFLSWPTWKAFESLKSSKMSVYCS